VSTKRHSPAIEAHLRAIAEEVVSLPTLALVTMHTEAEKTKGVIVAALSEWLSKQDPASQFTDEKYFDLLHALRRQGVTSGRVPQIPKWISLLGFNLRDNLLRSAEEAGQKAMDHTLSQTMALDLKNLDAEALQGVDTDRVLAQVRRSMAPRIRKATEVAAIGLYDRTKSVFYRGVMEGETIEAMGARIAGQAAADPAVFASAVGASLLLSLRHQLDRTIRTEVMRAYNNGARFTILGLAEANTQLVWFKRWDSSLDLKVCPRCRALHGEIVPLHKDFRSGGGSGPPLHPHCRCILTAWAERRTANNEAAEAASEE
jgi:SPP1 gp7 family putative phage head morphogenesis protein